MSIKMPSHAGKIAIALTLALLVAAVPLASPFSAAADEQSSRRIVTSGRAQLTAVPDMATVTIGTQYTAHTAIAAQTEVAKRMDAVTAALRKMGIADAAIQTASFQVGPEYDYNNGTRILKGYTVSHQLAVKVTDLTQLGAVFDAVVAGGATNIDNVRFETSKAAAIQRQALKAAVEDARERAAALAEGAGVASYRIVRIQDQSPQVDQPRFDAVAYEKLAASRASTEIAPGEITIEASVQVEFEF